MIPAGKFEAVPIDWGFDKSSTGKLYAWIKFETITGEECIWKGYFSSQGAKQISLKTLVTCGFQGGDVGVLLIGKNGAGLNIQNPVSLEIIHEDYKGKTYAKVKWVNSLDQNFERPIPTENDLRKDIHDLGLNHDLAVIRDGFDF